MPKIDHAIVPRHIVLRVIVLRCNAQAGAALTVTGPADPGRPAVAKIIGVIAGAGGGDFC